MRSRQLRPSNYALVALCTSGLITSAVVGCKPSAPASPNTTPASNKQAVRPTRIIAQGQIQPSGGLIRLSGTPGDAVDQINVAVGDQVKSGQVLITLRSALARQTQLDTLTQQLADAQLQQAASVERAQIDVSASQLQLKQATEQLQSVTRSRPSLDLLKQQWQDGQAALARIQTIANDPLTKAMVSRLDIDKQRANVTAAQLQFQTQNDSLEQADLAAKGAVQLAEEKLRAAQKSLELAQKVNPSAVLEAQIATAKQQLSLSQITSPIDGTVVSLDARVGENVAQFPLAQVADLSHMICQVEVYQTDAPLVKLGQPAILRSDAFEKPLVAKVSRIDRLIGHPQLRATDPLAKTDYRTLPVQVEIDAADVAVAARWLQLQVEVSIPLDTANAGAGS